MPVGVAVAVADLLGEAAGLDVAWLDGVGDEPGVTDGAALGEGVAAGEGVDVLEMEVGVLLTDAAFAARSEAGAAAAIMIPATIATTPPMAPAPSNRIVQVDAA